MVRPTTLRHAFVRGLHRRTLWFRITSSCPTRLSASAKGKEPHMSFAWAKPYEPKAPLMRWLDERLPLPRLVYGAVGGGYPVPRNLNYWWNFGVLAGMFLTIQIVTGIVLAMWYYASADGAFNSVEHIMRDVNAGWALRYVHMNGASFFFVVTYIHIFRCLFFGSYNPPLALVFLLVLFISPLMMVAAFVFYFLPWGQMSYLEG